MRSLSLAATAASILCLAAADVPPSSDFILASTTSLRDTGLLDLLTARFREQTGIVVKAISAGTGR